MVEEESFLCIDQEIDQVKLLRSIKSKIMHFFLTNSGLNFFFFFFLLLCPRTFIFILLLLLLFSLRTGSNAFVFIYDETSRAIVQ